MWDKWIVKKKSLKIHLHEKILLTSAGKDAKLYFVRTKGNDETREVMRIVHSDGGLGRAGLFYMPGNEDGAREL